MKCLTCGRHADAYASGLVGSPACETCAIAILEQCHREGGHPSNEHAGECGLCDAAHAKGEAEERMCRDCGVLKEGMGGLCDFCQAERNAEADTLRGYTHQEAYDHANPPLRDDPMETER